MVARPELVSLAERRDVVTCDYAERHPVRPRGPSWVGEVNISLFDRQTGDHPPVDGHGRPA